MTCPEIFRPSNFQHNVCLQWHIFYGLLFVMVLNFITITNLAPRLGWMKIKKSFRSGEMIRYFLLFYSLKPWNPISCLVLGAPICHVIRARSRGSPITVRNVCNCGYLLLYTWTLHCVRFLISLLFKPMDTYQVFLKIVFQDFLSSNLLHKLARRTESCGVIGYPRGQDGVIFLVRDYPPCPARK